MGAFELNGTEYEESLAGCPPKRIMDECIVAYKVYDSCRRQNCLTYKELGPPQYAPQPEPEPDPKNGDEPAESTAQEGNIEPPEGTASVSMDKLTISKIQVMSKQPSPFRSGYWDVEVQYVFDYFLTFRDSSGKLLEEVEANSLFNMRTTLFGSLGSELVVGTDLFAKEEQSTFEAAPFIWVEAKAVALDVRLHHQRRPGPEPVPPEIHLTLGLFAILKLFRLVHLNVQSTGFCIPEECKESNDINPCEYFKELEFPMDIFAPPQKPDFKP